MEEFVLDTHYFGALGIVWIKYIYPWLIKFIDKIDYDVGKKLAIWLSVFLLFDGILTGVAINRARQKKKVLKQNINMKKYLIKPLIKNI